MTETGSGFVPSGAGGQAHVDGGKGSYGQMIMPGIQEADMNVSGIPQGAYPEAEDGEDVNLDDYEMVGPEFFAQPKEPAFTINVNKITVNAAGVRMLPGVDYVKILLNQREKKLVLKPCSELDVRGYRWARAKDGKRYASQRTGEPFVLIICEIMGWDPNDRHKIPGRKTCSKGEEILVFDLTRPQSFKKPPRDENGKMPKRSALPYEWNGSFGPKYGEDRRSLGVRTFDGYTVFTVKGEASEAIEDETDNETDNGSGSAVQLPGGDTVTTVLANGSAGNGTNGMVIDQDKPGETADTDEVIETAYTDRPEGISDVTDMGKPEETGNNRAAVPLFPAGQDPGTSITVNSEINKFSSETAFGTHPGADADRHT